MPPSGWRSLIFKEMMHFFENYPCTDRSDTRVAGVKPRPSWSLVHWNLFHLGWGLGRNDVSQLLSAQQAAELGQDWNFLPNLTTPFTPGFMQLSLLEADFWLIMIDLLKLGTSSAQVKQNLFLFQKNLIRRKSFPDHCPSPEPRSSFRRHSPTWGKTWAAVVAQSRVRIPLGFFSSSLFSSLTFHHSVRSLKEVHLYEMVLTKNT